MSDVVAGKLIDPGQGPILDDVYALSRCNHHSGAARSGGDPVHMMGRKAIPRVELGQSLGVKPEDSLLSCEPCSSALIEGDTSTANIGAEAFEGHEALALHNRNAPGSNEPQPAAGAIAIGVCVSRLL